MPTEDFTVESLAVYLHLEASKVSRLAERGKLPGRKVAGRWRFSSAEIHHWLEQRIGASDEEELARVEGVLNRSVGDDLTPPSVAGLIPLEAIAIPLVAKTRNSVIRSMTELAAATGWLWDPVRMAEAVRAREAMHPTALENGVAMLHPRRPMASILGQPVVALGRTSTGIPFGGSHGTLTDVFFLISSIDDRGHLQTLARLSRLIGDPAFLSQLRSVPDAAAAHQLIVDSEQALVGEE